MSDVKWIQIATGIFDNRKIKQIERMPEGDAIIVVWFKLLCLTGICNKNGLIYFTEEIPYTEEMLAVEFGMEQPQRLNVLKLALRTFVQFSMIEIIEDVYSISSWERYQNVAGLDKIREQNRIRQARFKENQKMLSDNVNSNVTDNEEITQGNATEIEIDIDIDKDIKKDIKHKYGEYHHVLLTDKQRDKLISELGQELFDKCIKKLDEYIQDKGGKYKDHNLTIHRWVINSVKEDEARMNKLSPAKAVPTNRFNQFPQRQYSDQDYADLERKLINKR